MKSRIHVLLLFMTFTLFAFTSSFAEDNNDHSTKPSFNKEDAEIIKIMMTVDKNEIAAAHLALEKDIHSDVKNYAHFLLRQHTAHLHHIIHFSQAYHVTPLSSSISKTLEKAGSKEYAALKALHDEKFAYKYVKGMINDHKAGLQLIDTHLLKNVSNEKLKQQVEEFRMMVNNHLQKAIKLQSYMQRHHH